MYRRRHPDGRQNYNRRYWNRRHRNRRTGTAATGTAATGTAAASEATGVSVTIDIGATATAIMMPAIYPMIAASANPMIEVVDVREEAMVEVVDVEAMVKVPGLRC